jgi:hypothetical protein
MDQAHRDGRGNGPLALVVPDGALEEWEQRVSVAAAAKSRGVTDLDRVLGEHGAVELDRREAELLGNLGVLDLGGLLERHALDVLGDEGRGGDSRATT